MVTTTVWVLSGHTESYDEYVYVFGYKPSDEEALEFLKEEWPEEWEVIGFFNFGISEETVINK